MTRPFDKHLDSDELDMLATLQGTGVSDSDRLSELALREAQHHVQSCQGCSQKLQMHKFEQRQILQMRALNRTPPAPECMGDAEWLKVAAGLLPEAKTRELMKHAAQCGHCGPLLKNAAEALSDEATSGEEALLASLNSARPEWQKNMAATLRDDTGAKDLDRMRNRMRKKNARWWHGLFPWPRPAFALAGFAVAILAGYLGSRMLHPPSAEQLLAQAYTEHRTLEMRIQGARYAPLRVERSPGGSSLDKPAALLKAEVLIGENLKKNPNDTAWLQAKARADLLDGSYESAIQSLQHALETEPNSPGLLTDLASAYFQRAEGSDSAIDYGYAFEALGKALAKAPDDPVALFNRAIASERVFLYTQAVDDWEHYLRVEPNGEWSEDARKRLAVLREKLKTHEQSLAEPLLSPSDLVSVISPTEDVRWASVDARVEDYLQVALLRWLPAAFLRPADENDNRRRQAAVKALSILAGYLSHRHGDNWLADFIEATPSRDLSLAIHALDRGIEANLAGNPSLGHSDSLQAEAFFQKAGSQAGVMRAEIEVVYSLHRLFRGSDCIQVAQQLEQRLQGRKYVWIEAQLKLEQFACFDSRAKMDRGQTAVQEALLLANRAAYSTLYLRAIGFKAVMETDRNNLAAAEAWDHAGLLRYWSGVFPPVRAYQFYDDITDHARHSESWHFALALGREATQIIAATSNRSAEAMSRFRLAISASMAGNPEESAKEYTLAESIYSALPQDAATRGFEADSELQLAEAEALMGRHTVSEAQLVAAKTRLPAKFDSYTTWLTYYRTKAEILRPRGDDESLRHACTAVVAIGESGLRSLANERDRFAWNHSTSGCYKTLVEVALHENEFLPALELWEWYLSVGMRTHQPLISSERYDSLDRNITLPRLSDVQQNLGRISDATVLSYAQLHGSVFAWIYDDRGVSWGLIQAPSTDVTRLAKTFAAECADPNSDLNALRRQGQLLYSLLIAPFSERLSTNRTLIIEAEGSLASIPFQALVAPDGSYLGLSHTLVMSPGLGYMLNLQPTSDITSMLSTLLVGEPETYGPTKVISRPLPDALREVQQISYLFPNSQLLVGKAATDDQIRRQLSGVTIFHFAGHAISGPEGTGLLVAHDSDSPVPFPQPILGLEEISPHTFRHVRLAVLSACSTGTPGADGFADPHNLVTAFLRAGVPHVVASRWTLDSTSAAAFMTLFYADLLRNNSVAKAIQNAAFQLYRADSFRHPYYWAAFNAFGRA